MKKQLVIIGIIAILVCVGLGGCQQSSENTSIADIRSHSNKYINQTVTLTATYIGDDSSTVYTIMNSASISAINSKNIIKPTPVVSGSIYKFTGIVRYSTKLVMLNGLYLEVSKIETT